jgi:hypothetical protein
MVSFSNIIDCFAECFARFLCKNKLYFPPHLTSKTVLDLGRFLCKLVAPFFINPPCVSESESIFYSEPKTTKTTVAFQYSEAAKHLKMINTLGMVVLGIFILGIVVLGTVHSRLGPF